MDSSGRKVVAVAWVALAAVIILGGMFAYARLHAVDNKGHAFGLSRDEMGFVVLHLSRCEPSGIGQVQVGIGGKGQRPKPVYVARLTDPQRATSILPMDSEIPGYEIEGAISVDGPESMVIYDLNSAAGGNLLVSAFRFMPVDLQVDQVLRGDGAVISLAEWESTASC